MSLREKAAQLVFVDLRMEKADFERTTRLVRAGVGGLCLFGGSIFDVAPTLNAMQQHARVPLLVAADYEHGVGYEVRGATVLPTNMAVGAADSEELAALKGRVTAREARALGVPWLFAPVVDLQSNPRNPIVNVRSFGDDPARVVRLARAFIRGAREERALVCLKHFPGHGDVAQDSHLVLPRVEGTAEALRARELRPYAELAGEADAVMTAHLRVDAFDGERPASLSRAVTTDLLRGDLRFDGLVCTDALMMGAIRASAGPQEAVLRAIEAGADAALYPDQPEESIDAIVRAVESGRLDEETLDRSIQRLWAAKQRAGLTDADAATADAGAVEAVVGCGEHRAAAAKIAEASITTAFDRAEALPLRGPAKYAAMRDDSARGDLTHFERELAKRGKLSEDGRTGVLAIFSKYRSFSGRTEPDRRLVEEARRSLGDVERLAVVSFGNPYVIDQVPGATAYVCAWGESEHAQVAAARALAGEIPFRGKLPVALACP